MFLNAIFEHPIGQEIFGARTRSRILSIVDCIQKILDCFSAGIITPVKYVKLLMAMYIVYNQMVPFEQCPSTLTTYP